MKTNQIKYGILLLACFLAASCGRRHGSTEAIRLERLDSLVYADPEAASDSLSAIGRTGLTGYHRAYHQLLDVIAKDKTYHAFASDSQINAAAEKLSEYEQDHPDTYARALIYQGLVRFRLGISDSTAFLPMKKGVEALKKISPQDLKSLYLGNYYLSTVHDKNENYETSHDYLLSALHLAEKLNDKDFLYFCYTALAWNRLHVNDLPLAKEYIGRLAQYVPQSGDYRYDYLKLSASYHYYLKEYDQSLELEFKVLDNINPADSHKLSSAYYSISQVYRSKGDLAMAFGYDKKALQLADTTQPFIFVVYNDLGVLAERLDKWEEAAVAYRTAYHFSEKSVVGRIDRQLQELEKKYDFAEAELKKLQAERRLLHISIISSVFILLLLIGVTASMRMAASKQKALLTTKNEKMKLEIENEQLQHENKRKEWSTALLLFIARQQEITDELLYQISICKEAENIEKIKNKLDAVNKNFLNEKRQVIESLTTDEVFYQLVGLEKEKASCFNGNERMLAVLVFCGFTKDKIALMLASTPESIRVRTHKLRIKLESLGITFPDPCGDCP